MKLILILMAFIFASCAPASIQEKEKASHRTDGITIVSGTANEWGDLSVFTYNGKTFILFAGTYKAAMVQVQP